MKVSHKICQLPNMDIFISLSITLTNTARYKRIKANQLRFTFMTLGYLFFYKIYLDKQSQILFRFFFFINSILKSNDLY